MFVYVCLSDSYWSQVENRRNYFYRFAQDRRFNPLVPGNWYQFTIADMPNKVKYNPEGINVRNLLMSLPECGKNTAVSLRRFCFQSNITSFS